MYVAHHVDVRAGANVDTDRLRITRQPAVDRAPVRAKLQDAIPAAPARLVAEEGERPVVRVIGGIAHEWSHTPGSSVEQQRPPEWPPVALAGAQPPEHTDHAADAHPLRTLVERASRTGQRVMATPATCPHRHCAGDVPFDQPRLRLLVVRPTPARSSAKRAVAR